MEQTSVVDIALEAAGGPTNLAMTLGVPVRNIYIWKQKKRVPRWWLPIIARELSLNEGDLTVVNNSFTDPNVLSREILRKTKRAPRAMKYKIAEAAYVEKYGCSKEERLKIPANARLAFSQQKSSAKQRGIAFVINISDWWRIWTESGKWNERGVGHGYVMARSGDNGPYSKENVYICTGAQNIRDYFKNKKKWQGPIQKPLNEIEIEKKISPMIAIAKGI